MAWCVRLIRSVTCCIQDQIDVFTGNGWISCFTWFWAQLGHVLKAVRAANGIAVVTADHGNADLMFKMKNGEKTISYSHSKNPVPFTIYDPGYRGEYVLNPAVENPGLTNVAGSLLWLMGFVPPEDYDAPLIVPR